MNEQNPQADPLADETTRRFFEAAGDLAGELLNRLKADDPEGHAAIARELRAGGFFTLICAFGTAGPIDTRLQFVARDGGERITLFEVREDDVRALQ